MPTLLTLCITRKHEKDWLVKFYKMVQVEDLTTGLGRSCGGGSVYNPSKYNLKAQRGY